MTTISLPKNDKTNHTRCEINHNACRDVLGCLEVEVQSGKKRQGSGIFNFNGSMLESRFSQLSLINRFFISMVFDILQQFKQFFHLSPMSFINSTRHLYPWSSTSFISAQQISPLQLVIGPFNACSKQIQQRPAQVTTRATTDNVISKVHG